MVVRTDTTQKFLVTFRKDPALAGTQEVEATAYHTEAGWVTFTVRDAPNGPSRKVASFPAAAVQSVTSIE